MSLRPALSSLCIRRLRASKLPGVVNSLLRLSPRKTQSIPILLISFFFRAIAVLLLYQLMRPKVQAITHVTAAATHSKAMTIAFFTVCLLVCQRSSRSRGKYRDNKRLPLNQKIRKSADFC